MQLNPFTSKNKFWRNFLEFAVIILLGLVMSLLIGEQVFSTNVVYCLIVGFSLTKTIFFVLENSQEVIKVTHTNVPYHVFLWIMGINMTQIAVSFAIDYYVLYKANTGNFNGIAENFNEFELQFEFLYFSILNFSFFGYGDITPNTVPAKMVTLLEITLAFLTVIFILSDFITLKDSLKESDMINAWNKDKKNT